MGKSIFEWPGLVPIPIAEPIPDESTEEKGIGESTLVEILLSMLDTIEETAAKTK